MTIIGYQVIAFGCFTRTYAEAEGFYPPHPWISRLTRPRILERGLIAGVFMILMGLVFFAGAFYTWKKEDYGALNPRITMRSLIPCLLLVSIGLQSIFSSFFLGILRPELRSPRERPQEAPSISGGLEASSPAGGPEGQ